MSNWDMRAWADKKVNSLISYYGRGDIAVNRMLDMLDTINKIACFTGEFNGVKSFITKTNRNIRQILSNYE